MSLPNVDTLAAPSLPPTSTNASKAILPWLVAVAFFMESLDTTILNTAVPTIAEALQVAPLSMKSVLASYTLSLAVFIPISGWMADRFGTRRVFASAIGMFTLGSFLCGIVEQHPCTGGVPHTAGLRRSHDGAGRRLTMVRTFAKSELVRAMSFVAIPALIGPMLGPVAGGLDRRLLSLAGDFLREHSDRAVGLYLVYRHLPDYRERTESAGRGRAAPVWLRRGAAVVRAGGIRRTHAEHARNTRACWRFSIAATGRLWISCVAGREFPLLRSEAVSASARFARR